MPASVVKKGLIGLILVLLVLSSLAALLPAIVSSSGMRDRIAGEVGAWTGYKVTLGDEPDISIFPAPRAVLRDVTLSRWAGSDEPAAIRIERVEIDLAPLAALVGRVSFTSLSLIRPLFRLVRGEGKHFFPPLPASGRLVRAVNAAGEAVRANPSSPDFGSLSTDALGDLTLRDGRIVLYEETGESELLSSINGTLSWPMLDRRASFEGEAIWHGEVVSVVATSENPLVMLSGNSSALSIALNAAPLRLTFDGRAGFSGQSFIDGALEFSSPSLRRTMEWSRTDIQPGEAIGSLSLKAKATGGVDRMKLEDVAITVDGNTGVGALSLSLGQPVPQISGTLAFSRLDLMSFAQAFSALLPGNARMQDPQTVSYVDQIDFDLRLSAGEASVGKVNLSNIAATAKISKGLAAFDISDASAFSGTIQAGFRIDDNDGRKQGEIRLLAREVKFDEFSRALGDPNIIPETTGMISVILKGPAGDWESFARNANGSVSLKLGQGQIRGIDFSSLIANIAGDDFFSLKDISGGAFPFRQAELKAVVSNGVAEIEKAEFLASQGAVKLAGIVPYLGRSLALSGTIFELGTTDSNNWIPKSMFFVGGSWDNPYISAMNAPVLPN